MKHLSAFISKMEKEGISPLVINTFSYYYKKVVEGETGLILDRDIDPVDKDELKDANSLESWTAAGKEAFKHAVRIILNGGLGTSMGLTGPKSLVKVKDGQTFLEIILQQAEYSQVKLALMNSFSTHEDTLLALSKIDPPIVPRIFLQHKFPKILHEGLSPATWPEKPELEWNPPGHGDVYTALYASGMLKTLLEEDIRYAFISNCDNLGAGMDASLLGYFAENNYPFMMEVAQKTPADLKGGHLARQKNGRLILREIAQCHENERGAFEDIRRYRFFNTNNIWVNLKFLSDLIEKDKAIRLPMILNPKTLDPRNEDSPGVFQIETAMGAAISLFAGATAVKVPRSRFFPVKKCNDLVAVRSDCFVFSRQKNLMINPVRMLKQKPDTIKIDLDPKYYGKIELLEQRFKDGVPSLVDCESLTVEGDVFFSKNIRIKGEVKITNSKNSRADIKEGSVIQGVLNLYPK
ncbi:MAG: UTP--glucose-1-phosphate uridylyltransferase [Thermodesulfobacteriota bacterium]|nr:UTP--glucose-1-phosphate uridylyltransferase [Thermodesulfobacteriota bacterium]